MVDEHLKCPLCKMDRELMENEDLKAKVYICPKCGSMGIEGYKTPVMHFDFQLERWFVVEKDQLSTFKEVLAEQKAKAVEEFKKKNVI